MKLPHVNAPRNASRRANAGRRHVTTFTSTVCIQYYRWTVIARREREKKRERENQVGTTVFHAVIC